MDVAHPVGVLLQHGQGILAGEGEVAGVIAQEHIPGIGVGHHAVRLLAGLDHGAHVMVEAQLEASVRGDPAQLVQPSQKRFHSASSMTCLWPPVRTGVSIWPWME